MSNPIFDTPLGLVYGTQGASFSYSFTASGGSSPYIFTLASGSLPPGLSLGSNGAVTGTPTASGDYPFTLHIVDNAAAVVSPDPFAHIYIFPSAEATFRTAIETAITAGLDQPGLATILFSESELQRAATEVTNLAAVSGLPATPYTDTEFANLTAYLDDGNGNVDDSDLFTGAEAAKTNHDQAGFMAFVWFLYKATRKRKLNL